MSPLVSIIIPTYNRAHLIGETLDSIIAQTYTNWECIVVDDGSTDGTDELLTEYCKKDGRFQYHHRPKDRPKGANTCRNYGFELSKGEYVNWFDSDDIMLPDFLKIKYEVFEESFDLVICTGYKVDENLQNREAIFFYEKDNLFKEYVLWRLQVLTPSILFRKRFLMDKELFSLDIYRGQETEFFSRLFFTLVKTQFKVLNKPMFLYRFHDNTKTKKNNLYVKKYKESRRFISLENLKRSIKMQDEELVHFYYKDLINLFFRGLENNHINNSKEIIRTLASVFKESNSKLVTELYFFSTIFYLINRGSYKVEKYLKNYKISL